MNLVCTIQNSPYMIVCKMVIDTGLLGNSTLVRTYPTLINTNRIYCVKLCIAAVCKLGHSSGFWYNLYKLMFELCTL